MKRNYFEYNGQKYYSGTVIIVNDFGKITEATFVCYDIERKSYVYKITHGATMICNESGFYNDLVSVTNKINTIVKNPINQCVKTSNIEGMFLGWLWYIVIMIVAALFNDCIQIWAIATVIFFAYRGKKIKEEENYIEW